jgi:uncharacterized membrane protein
MTDDTKQTTGEGQPQPTKSGNRSLRIALGVSLAFNVLIVGMIAGGLASGRHMSGPGGFSADLGPFDRAMSIEDRRGLAGELRDRPEIGRTGAQDMSRIRAAFLDALVAEPFDPAALGRIFAKERERGVQVMQVGQDLLLRRIASMSLEQRQIFARRLSRQWDGHDDD